MTTTYRQTPSQMHNRIIGSAILAGLTAVGCLIGWANMKHGHPTPGIWQALVFAAVPGTFLLVYAPDSLSRTEVSDTELRVARPLRRRRYDWSEIADIARSKQGGRGGTADRLRVTPAKGRPFNLPSPLTPHPSPPLRGQRTGNSSRRQQRSSTMWQLNSGARLEKNRS